MDLLDELLLLLRLEAVVPLCQAGLASAVLDQDELDGHGDGEEEEGDEEAGTERHEIAEKKRTPKKKNTTPPFSQPDICFSSCGGQKREEAA